LDDVNEAVRVLDIDFNLSLFDGRSAVDYKVAKKLVNLVVAADWQDSLFDLRVLIECFVLDCEQLVYTNDDVQTVE
jgi:hypothetical protein